MLKRSHRAATFFTTSIAFLVAVSCASAHEEQPAPINYPEDHGTWSIAAIDTATGQIGIAGASCTHNVQGIGEVIPGLGVVIVQGMSSDEARELGMNELRAGSTPQEIVKAMRDVKFDPENQQYAVLSRAQVHNPASFTGNELDSWHGTAAADGVTVQGNSLVGEDVVTKSLAAFQASSGVLAEKLVSALAAGAEAGGDKRCGDQRARSAFVTVYNSDDPESTPYFHLVVYGTEKGGVPAVARLEEEFDHLFPRNIGRVSTRIYMIPTLRSEIGHD